MAVAHGTALDLTWSRPGSPARDWAEIQERTLVPLYEAVHERLGVGPATSLLGLGCRSGLALLLAAARGAQVAGLEPDGPLRELARARGLTVTSAAELRPGTGAGHPAETTFATRTAYAAVTLFEPLRLGPDPRRTVREALRSALPGGVLVLAGLDPVATGRTAAVLAPAHRRAGGARVADPLDPAGDPEALAAAAGLRLIGRGHADCPFGHPDLDSAVRGLLSTGWYDAAVGFAGEVPVAKELAEALHPFTRSDGSVWLPVGARYVLAARG